MKDKVVIVGAGGAAFAQKALQDMGHENVIVISPEDAKQETFPKSEPFIISHPPHLPAVARLFEEKKFVCKGIHQYRLSDTVKKDMGEGSLITEIWKCQCSKILGS